MEQEHTPPAAVPGQGALSHCRRLDGGDDGRSPHVAREEKTVKVHVDPERCQGHTLCAMIAPDMFELDDVDGHSSPVSEQVPANQEAKVAEAVRSCPEQAISIS